jgi:cysteine dioxygenase
MESTDFIIERITLRHHELGKKFNINQLRSIIREKATPLEEFNIESITFNEEPYIRTTLYTDEHLEVVLIKWKPGATSLIHDHGSSYGIVRVLQGSIGFELYNVQLERMGEGIVPAVDTFDLPEGIMHKMFNSNTDEIAITLHFYCPKITCMNVYDLEKMKQLKMENGDNAWQIPTDKIISEQKLGIPKEEK